LNYGQKLAEDNVSIQGTHVLNSDKVRPNKWYVVHFAKHAHNTAVVNTRNQNGEEVIEEGGVFLEVESKGLVVTAEKI